MPTTDIITDTLERIHAAHPVPARVRKRIERELREDWGGEFRYIQKTVDEDRQQLTQRDQQIRREFRRGEREAYLARKHGISIKRVRQILQCSGDIAAPTTKE